MRKNLKMIYVVLFSLLVVNQSFSGIQYASETDSLIVSDYPEHLPCTLERLAKVDALYGWNRVVYDANSDTYTVSARLIIGTNDGSNTWFQIGDSKHPKVTLIMKKDLIVAPHWMAAVNRGKSWWLDAPKDTVNRLTIGDPVNKKIKATLIFNAGTLWVGRIPDVKGECFGGQIHVHYGTLRGLLEQPYKKLKNIAKGNGMKIIGNSSVFNHAVITDFSGFMVYGLSSRGPKSRYYYYQLQNTIFENGGVGLVNGRQDARNCEFRNLTIGVMDYGCLNATLLNCVFKNNLHNWSLTHSKKGLTLIDCVFDEPKKGDIIKAKKQNNKTVYPELIVKRHVIVAVTNPEGQPFEGAEIKIRNEQEVFHSVENGNQITDSTGRTPGRGNPKAILLRDYIKKASDIPNQPKTSTYTYCITVKFKGFVDKVVTEFRPQTNWEQINISLKRKGQHKK